MARMAHAGPEVAEEHAAGQVKSIYDDVKATLRVPLVHLFFRRLAASYPDYLQLAWRQLQPNARTVYFERCADDLRARAVRGVAELGSPPDIGGNHDLGATIRVFHYINPKLLLAVTAIRSATSGQSPKLQELPAREKRQIPSGVPADALAISMIDPDTADEQVRSIFDDMQRTLKVSVVNSEYRALARSPEYLQRSWGALKPVTERPEYRQLQGDLRRAAEEAVAALPYRMDLNPHALRHAGQSEHQIDGIRFLLSEFSRLLPVLVANTSFLAVGAGGVAEAATSPFPLTFGDSDARRY